MLGAGKRQNPRLALDRVVVNPMDSHFQGTAIPCNPSVEGRCKRLERVLGFDLHFSDIGLQVGQHDEPFVNLHLQRV